ncbi:MAG TPA: hypothetical protein PKA41_12770 [Verrucomicrobiota bacterium]|nr:hypothetical protein [Verrucomicrobiota bacterium]
MMEFLATATNATAHWLDKWQWPLCAGLLVVCVVLFVITSSQVRREMDKTDAARKQSGHR